ncbi:threonine--tRNA ligase, cytoplasmic [Pelomyxa schiedti]|nr:threonine--tRNA ligase, cytoplasmic [Pelomyxa schiedti]
MADQNPAPPSSAPQGPPVEKPAETAAPKAEAPKADAEAKPVSSNRPAKKSGTKPPPAAKPKAEKAPPSAEAQAAAAAARARAEATPPFWAARNELFEQLRVAYVAEIEARPKTPIEVKVLPPKWVVPKPTPGTESTTPSTPAPPVEPVIVQCFSYELSPLQVVKKIGTMPKSAWTEDVINCAVVAKVNNDLWDLTRPIETACVLELIPFDTEEGKHVFWHSSAHILGFALEKRYNCLLNVGPPTEKDFFYDIKTAEDTQVSASDFKDILSNIKGIVKQKHPFIRIEITKEQAAQMFHYNKYKLAIINKTPDGEKISAYKCGQLIDLCRGPHILHTGLPQGFSLNSTCSVYVDGKTDGDVLQRIYAVSFPTKEQLEVHNEKLKQAALRDHRVIGKQQELYFFHPWSPGSAFFQPHGYRIYRKLMDFVRGQYHQRGYEEVLTPNLYMSKLWETSGHWAHYQDCMFTLECDGVPWALKPMNCPGHCLVYLNRVRSYRELPIRMAEFGVLHRNELAGALHGLTRVRRFEQDDAHIFCRADQIRQEVAGAFDFVKFVYHTFHFDVHLELSTRPAKFMGEIAVWDKAESELKAVLEESGLPWKINPGDGAFYGPKIDVHIKDALDRFFQCATIQLDFQLPIKFDLQYMSAEEGKVERPVMVHRAILGSLERFIGILTEHLAGKWPFWISPRQVVVLPVSEQYCAYAHKVASMFHEAHFYVDVDDTDRSLQKKVREAQLSQYNFIVVVGKEEQDNNTINIRSRENVQRTAVRVVDFLAELATLEREYR